MWHTPQTVWETVFPRVRYIRTSSIFGERFYKMATKATGPLGNLTEGSTYYLIELFESHKELWDFRIPQYRNKQLKNSLWLSMQISFSSTTGIDCTGMLQF